MLVFGISRCGWYGEGLSDRISIVATTVLLVVLIYKYLVPKKSKKTVTADKKKN